MKKSIMFAAWLLMIGIMLIPAQGQTYEVKVNVPFNFGLENKTYPSGEYVFSSTKDTLFVESPNGARIAMALANRVSGLSGKGGKVVFKCYSTQCFLFEAWIPGLDGRQVLTSRTEVQAASRERGQYMALLGTE